MAKPWDKLSDGGPWRFIYAYFTCTFSLMYLTYYYHIIGVYTLFISDANSTHIAIDFSQKQLRRKMKSRYVIIECVGYIFLQLF